jgi:hypothetical protein
MQGKGENRMALIKRFEDIHAWQEARILVKQVYLLTREGEFARDFGLRDQIQKTKALIGALKHSLSHPTDSIKST